MFTDTIDLAGTGEKSWINEDRRSVLLGLEVPATIETATDLDDGGMLSGGGATFTVADFDGSTLLALVKEPSDRDFVYQRLAPGDDPAPVTLLGNGGEDVDLHGRYVGAEFIGGSGERRRYQCLPGDPMPGLDHAAFNGTNQDLPEVVITDEPEHAPDLRRVALYLIHKDTLSGLSGADAWPSWSDQFASGYSLIWWGTLSSVENSGRTWQIKCDGPGAWLRKQINANTPDVWAQVQTILKLKTTGPDREDLFASAFLIRHALDFSFDTQCGYSTFDVFNDVITGTTVKAVVSAISSRLTTISAAAGPDSAFTTQGGAFQFTSEHVSIKYDNGSSQKGAEMWVCLHEKVWRFLGWDPKVQHRTYLDIQEPYDCFFIDHSMAKFRPFSQVNVKPPGPGYYTAVFTTLPYGDNYQTNPEDADNNGNWRSFLPLSPPGVAMLYPEGGQEIGVAFGVDSPYCEGQLARPPADYTLTSGETCDTAGYMVFRGQYRESAEEDARELYQVAKVSWHDHDGTFSEDAEGNRVVVIEKWLDPRMFGYSDPPLKLVWSSDKIEWAPLRVLGYNLDTMDHAHMVLVRLMLSTGTASWDPGSYEGGATSKNVGTNNHLLVYDGEEEANDHEFADLGLAIPADVIDRHSFTEAAMELPEGYKGPLNRCKIAFKGAQDSQEVIRQIIEPRGWALGLHGFKYGLFNVGRLLYLHDATVTITESDLASDDVPYVPSMDLFPMTPFDKASIEHHYPAAGEGGETATIEGKSLSRRTRGRHGNATRELQGLGYVDLAAWKGESSPVPAWINDWRQLWLSELADWYAQPHELITGLPLKPSKAIQVNPGTVVLISNAWPATRTGAYGMTGRVGRVLRVVRNLEDLTAEVDILVQAGDPNVMRLFAPIAVVLDDVSTVEARYDLATRTFKCHADYFGTGTGRSDVNFFAEPSWSNLGGNLEVDGYQYNGRTWTQTFSFSVESVDTDNHTIMHTAAGLAGTFYDRMYTILVPQAYSAQGATWPKAWFVVHTDPAGKFGGAPGFKFL
ncbi:hypothetical protein [Nannocystis pusilla]|uniref:hypothetical protein n=1 Tax=Nannocystis pusilla TaxID=889268 RepID=UPI003DA300CA